MKMGDVHKQLLLNFCGGWSFTFYNLFIYSFSYEDSDRFKLYMDQIDELKNPGRNTLYVKFSHISAYSAVLSATIELQFHR